MLKAILHYALGLRFGNLKRSKTQEKTQLSRFYPTDSVFWKNFLAFYLRFRFFSSVWIPTCWYPKR